MIQLTSIVVMSSISKALVYVVLTRPLGIEGYLPERLCMEMVWGRVANLSGGPGNNVPLDLANEFMNNEFKGNY